MNLPTDSRLAIDKLASVFNDTTNSYKYYWFLAFLEGIKEGKNQTMEIENLVIKMITMAWFPINYYRLSLGKQDQLANKIKDLKSLYNFPQDIKKKDLEAQLLARRQDKEMQDILKMISKYVPFRFIRPFFAEATKGLIDNEVNAQVGKFAKDTAHELEKASFYYFSDNMKSIIINSFWLSYLEQHLFILESFCKYHLILYLQKNNPNTPNVIDKLEAVTERDLKNGKLFWKTYLQQAPALACIYSKDLITLQDISIDHFLPFSFVAHDLLWNLLPTTKSVNSSKSDKIPDLKTYFQKFATLQFEAFRANFDKQHFKILEDYSNLFNEDLQNIYQKNTTDFSDILEKTIVPLVQIASNMGFQKNWIY